MVKMQYRVEVDGLRALAVVPVILYHAGFKLFSGGYVGVDIFFVISGYLLTTIILTELESDSFSLIDFCERRARNNLTRIFGEITKNQYFSMKIFPLNLSKFLLQRIKIR
jgi:peptidoglycan/LPS O-acetylase OafA/YrhL